MYNTADEIRNDFIKKGWSDKVMFSELTLQEAEEKGYLFALDDIPKGKKYFVMENNGDIYDNKGEVAVYNIPCVRQEMTYKELEEINNQNGKFNDSPHHDTSYKWQDPYEQMQEYAREQMENKFDLDCDIPYGSNRYVQMTNGYVLEIGCEEYPSDPFGSICAGNYSSGKSYAEAYNDAWGKMSSKTNDAIKEKVAQYLFDNMKVEDGVVKDTMISGAVIDEYDSKVITFPNLIEDMCLAIEDEELAKLTPDDLLEMVMNDYYDPFCGSDGRFSFEKLSDFCEEHDIKLDDIVLIDTYYNGNDVAVVFIEPEAFESRFDDDFSKLTAEQKQSVLEESMSVLEEWDTGNVYCWTLYDKNGDEIDGMTGFYGDDSIKDVVANFDGWVEDVEPLYDLGIHNDIANCLYANRDTVSHDEEER